eukprot:239942-Prymnesium_polylepis.1
MKRGGAVFARATSWSSSDVCARRAASRALADRRTTAAATRPARTRTRPTAPRPMTSSSRRAPTPGR